MLTALCVVPYIRDIRRGTTRPHRVSWFTFAALSTVAAVSQFVDGAGAGAWLAAGSAVGFTIVFGYSIRAGVGGSSWPDRCGLVLAAVGVALALVAREPLVAVVSVIAAELVAIALTAVKAVRDPDSETPTTWLFDCLAGGLAIAAVSSFSVTELMYPVHHTVANALVLAAIARGHAADQRTPVRTSRASAPLGRQTWGGTRMPSSTMPSRRSIWSALPDGISVIPITSCRTSSNVASRPRLAGRLGVGEQRRAGDEDRFPAAGEQLRLLGQFLDDGPLGAQVLGEPVQPGDRASHGSSSATSEADRHSASTSCT